MLNIANYKRNANLNYTSRGSEWPLLKSVQIINGREGVEKMEPSYSVGGNVNWYSYYGE